MIIQHNMNSMNSRGNLEKLSSVRRINSSDDAAGLNISDKMRSQIRGLTAQVRDAYGIGNYIQTGDIRLCSRGNGNNHAAHNSRYGRGSGSLSLYLVRGFIRRGCDNYYRIKLWRKRKRSDKRHDLGSRKHEYKRHKDRKRGS
ncbi:MAG: hypothetical protein K2O14_04720 [Oscillospiraceae bacterium]|nr:hypothetical protein [Oscillospiraceae bacterium]